MTPYAALWFAYVKVGDDASRAVVARLFVAGKLGVREVKNTPRQGWAHSEVTRLRP